MERQVDREPTHDSSNSPLSTRRALPIALLRAREAVMSHVRPMLARYGVTEQQWRVIRVLDEQGKLDASEVAERAFILAPSLTRMIRSLEERGLITRQSGEVDKRRVFLKIAPAGKALIRQVQPDSQRIYEQIEASYGRQRLDTLLELLDELASLKNEASQPVADE